MMADIEEIAKAMGAKIIGRVPNVQGGALGAAHLAGIYQARMEEVRKEQGPSTEKIPNLTIEIPIGEATAQALAELADLVSTPNKRISPMQVARGLLSQSASQWVEELRPLQSSFEESQQKLANAGEKLAAARREHLKALVECAYHLRDQQPAG
jgi:hypothetical protein